MKSSITSTRTPHFSTAVCAGIDIGSTTTKLVVLDSAGAVLWSQYQRHHADVRSSVASLLDQAAAVFGDTVLALGVTGSGGLLLANWLRLPFTQEVISSMTAVDYYLPGTDVAIELGGEDAKIIYFGNNVEQRMNGICAGGTGAFIDQMATLLGIDAAGLDLLARDMQTLYPIASRCGVFAKSDVQPLLNEGARKEDLAASILQSVVTQTIAGLACGRPIRGKVAFLGGPLHYLPQLRHRFIETLELTDEDALCPPQAHLFVAQGCALAAHKDCRSSFATADTKPLISFQAAARRLAQLEGVQAQEVDRLEPLFATREAYDSFCARHDQASIKRGDVADYSGAAFLGIDAGSTTFKAALIGTEGQLLWSHYGSNKGDVVNTARSVLLDLYQALPDTAHIAHACVTGYGERLLLEALRVDTGEIETVAHLRGAEEFQPDVDFILDIGGQDMKCLKVQQGVIDHIMLNEACSSGCGSFLASFATGLDLAIEDFAAEALTSRSPVDLGSRCTVFMNSRVKQAQKEGASVADISAGLSYSVIKNALYKVIKMRDTSDLGEKIVVQGGTFYNDAVLRAFELLTGREVIRPDIAGLMGAYGAALLAKDNAQDTTAKAAEHVQHSQILGRGELDTLRIQQQAQRCLSCPNACLLTINTFTSSDVAGTEQLRHFITGNRCERAATGTVTDEVAGSPPNLMAYKNQRLFNYTPLEAAQAPRGEIALPRMLNMYENYPFWHTFFTQLGFRVVLSGASDSTTLEVGSQSIPSESVCYPAKLAHGHVTGLIQNGARLVFMPCIIYERAEDPHAGNYFNCPVVINYAEMLRLNIDQLHDHAVTLFNPFVPYQDFDALTTRMFEALSMLYQQRDWNAYFKQAQGRQSTSRPEDYSFYAPYVPPGAAPSMKEIAAAMRAAWDEDLAYKRDVQAAGDAALAWIEQHKRHGIILAGRPYHCDPGVNHALPEMLNGLGLAVLTEDSLAHRAQPDRPMRIVDQWMYHSRLFAAAKFSTMRADLDLIQLNSFGCGLDATVCDQVQEIVEASGNIYTIIKIDEVSNLGAARIRARSLLAALKKRGVIADTESTGQTPPCSKELPDVDTSFQRTLFTEEMRDSNYTILCPQMSPIHFELLQPAVQRAGYNIEVLPSVDRDAIETGLRFVNNDVCYPSILVTGQILEALLSGRYDINRTAAILSQTGGGCRATNYLAFARKALRDAGLNHVPVVSLEMTPVGESHPGFEVSPRMLLQAAYSILLGDVLMQCLLRTRPFEDSAGSANKLHKRWATQLKEQLLRGMSVKQYRRAVKAIVHDFDTLPLTGEARDKTRVGIVGEILVKFHPTANNEVIELLEEQNCEVVVPGLTDFFLYSMCGGIFQRRVAGRPLKYALQMRVTIAALQLLRRPATRALAASKRFDAPVDIFDIARLTERLTPLASSCGEGWLLPGEMMELIESGTPNIVVASPFACLPNHTLGKGMIKELRRLYPESNIVAIDYDPGASEVNQLNRIKLMLSAARLREASDEVCCAT
ncbi:MAG: acyl-CoA dehydratase activase-related protein [Coriobacteriia bacterium]|nr:acyl-CoA dehydratase activase-related protein [Coriobacteriia bacterium]